MNGYQYAVEMSPPCGSRGARCASFRVSFYWLESDACPGGAVAAALQGMVGRHAAGGLCVLCPSTCRDFSLGDERCRKARRRHGEPT